MDTSRASIATLGLAGVAVAAGPALSLAQAWELPPPGAWLTGCAGCAGVVLAVPALAKRPRRATVPLAAAVLLLAAAFARVAARMLGAGAGGGGGWGAAGDVAVVALAAAGLALLALRPAHRMTLERSTAGLAALALIATAALAPFLPAPPREPSGAARPSKADACLGLDGTGAANLSTCIL
jgi:hypothetical protein